MAPSKPVIFAVDDEPYVLQAVETDLRREYGEDYRILSANSAAVALEALNKLKRRDEPVALVISDQRMPDMTGIELLEQVKTLYPSAKRILLTAYAETDVALRAINQVKIDHYLLKPWDPPEENLYPFICDLLDDWKTSFRPPFEGIRFVGYRWAPKTHEIRDFLVRNRISYQWYDLETNPEAKTLVESTGKEEPDLPLLFCDDDIILENPTVAEVAEHTGLQTHPEMPFYDLIIIGAGPAGLAAAVYGASEGLRTVLVERAAPGGQAGMSARIENYLGFPSGVSGGELARRAVTQIKKFGVELLNPQEAVNISAKDPYRIVELADGTILTGYAVLISTGVSYRPLDVDGCSRLTGAGIYYGAAMTEARLYEGADVYIVGGANSAGQAAMLFSRYARCTTMIIRQPALNYSMSRYLIGQIESTPSIRVLADTEVTEAHGKDNLEAITVKNNTTGETQTLPTNALFVFIGATPHTDWLHNIIQCNDEGFILTGLDLLHNGQRPAGWNLKRDPFLLESSVPGIFAAGDTRYRSVKRMASAVGEGAMTIDFIQEYVGNL
jgi:thioredoxin reductase (NADPH)